MFVRYAGNDPDLRPGLPSAIVQLFLSNGWKLVVASNIVSSLLQFLLIVQKLTPAVPLICFTLYRDVFVKALCLYSSLYCLCLIYISRSNISMRLLWLLPLLPSIILAEKQYNTLFDVLAATPTCAVSNAQSLARTRLISMLPD